VVDPPLGAGAFSEIFCIPWNYEVTRNFLILFDIMIAAMLRNTGFGADIVGGVCYGS